MLIYGRELREVYHKMQVDFDLIDNKLIVNLSGELDHHTAEEVRVKIDDMIDREGISKVILNFKKVTFMDSSGIGVVVGRYKKVNARYGRMCLVNPSSSVNRVFELSGLYKIISMYRNLGEALKSI